AWLAAEQRGLPELPAARRARFIEAMELPAYDTGVLTAEPAIADYFEAIVAAGTDPKTAANWVMGEGLASFNETGRFAVAPARIAELAALVAAGTVSLQAARKIHAELVGRDASPIDVAERLGLVQVQEVGALEAWVDAVIAAHPDEVARFRGGEGKLIGFFVGQVMKRSQGTADPKAIQPILKSRLAG